MGMAAFQNSGAQIGTVTLESIFIKPGELENIPVL